VPRFFHVLLLERRRTKKKKRRKRRRTKTTCRRLGFDEMIWNRIEKEKKIDEQIKS